jgi:hypothetical protein
MLLPVWLSTAEETEEKIVNCAVLPPKKGLSFGFEWPPRRETEMGADYDEPGITIYNRLDIRTSSQNCIG